MQFHKNTRSAFINFLRTKFARLNGDTFLRATPYHLYLDPSSCCPLRCQICVDPADPSKRRRTSTLMSPVLYDNLLDELGDNLFIISLYNWGEPLLNPNLTDFIKRAKQKNIYVDIHTSLNLELSDEALISLLQSGVDNFVVSIDGFSQEAYGRYRIGGVFDLARRNITRLTLLRDQLSLNTSITWKYLVFSFNEHEISLAENYCKSFGINFARSEAIIDIKSHPDWLPSYRKGEINHPFGGWPITRVVSPELKISKHEASCAWHYCYSCVNADGTVSPCCAVDDTKYDFDKVIPTIKKFTDIWNGDQFRSARSLMSAVPEKSVNNKQLICANCPFPILKDLGDGIDQFIINRYRQLFGTSEPILAEAFERLAQGTGFKEYVEANQQILDVSPTAVESYGSNSTQEGLASLNMSTAPAIKVACGRGTCPICGEFAEFTLDNAGFSLRETVCDACGASRRSRDLAAVILKTYDLNVSGSINGQQSKLSHLRIFEAQSSGPLHDVLRSLPGYQCAEFFDDTERGMLNENGVRCEDLQRLTFDDNSFDLIITQDVLEHVADPFLAFGEIRRVLRQGGRHIFTVPCHEGNPTITRAILNEDSINLIYPPVHHCDPLRIGGSLVFTDFGNDLVEILNPTISTEIALYNQFYPASAIPSVTDMKTYIAYKLALNSNDLLSFFTYNSIVYLSTKY